MLPSETARSYSSHAAGSRLAGAGVLLLPGTVYDEPDHARIGFGRANMPEALGLLETNLAGAE